MSLKDKLKEDLKAAMKDKDSVRKNVVQLIKAGVLQVEKDNKVTLDDEGVLDVIAKQLKQRRDSLPDYENGFQDKQSLQESLEDRTSPCLAGMSDPDFLSCPLCLREPAGAGSLLRIRCGK